MKKFLLLLPIIFIAGCEDPDYHVADGKILWDNTGCAYSVNVKNESYGPKIIRVPDVDKEGCKPSVYPPST